MPYFVYFCRNKRGFPYIGSSVPVRANFFNFTCFFSSNSSNLSTPVISVTPVRIEIRLVDLSRTKSSCFKLFLNSFTFMQLRLTRKRLCQSVQLERNWVACVQFSRVIHATKWIKKNQNAVEERRLCKMFIDRHFCVISIEQCAVES